MTLANTLIKFAAEHRRHERQAHQKLRRAIRLGSSSLVSVYVDSVDYWRRGRAEHLRNAATVRT